MNLRFIEAFVWVARLGSFTAAAEKLFSTQAAISARIASLEDDFGVKLFERTQRKVTLTHSGEELLKYAEQLLAVSARMFDAVADRANYRGRISVGAIEAVVHTWLPELMRQIQQSFAEARIEVHSYMTADLHEELLKGNIDVALTAEPVLAAAVENHRICEFMMAWVGRGDSITASTDGLKDGPILTFLRDSIVYRDVVAKLGDDCVSRINPISSIAAMVSLLTSGYGVATLPLAAVWRDVNGGALRALDIAPRLDALPIIASVRTHSESPMVAGITALAAAAARTFATGPLAELIVVTDKQI